jgi:signal transduction histidine kinase
VLGKERIILLAIEDITERREIENGLKKAHEELTELATELKRTARVKSEFLANMSHELRTPLNSIIGFTGIILQGIVGHLNDEQKKQLNMVRDSAQHLLSLINDVLDISKIEAGQLQIAYENYDLRHTIERAVESARPLAGKKGLELTCAISPEIETITSDHRRLEQILLNLISNAIKFTKKGSVKIECESEGDNVTIRVIDTGIGIKTEDMEIIFQAFRQIDSGMTRKYEGTGLGLSICKRLVELMGGKIWVTSVWGSGSTFSISLPKERKDV